PACRPRHARRRLCQTQQDDQQDDGRSYTARHCRQDRTGAQRTPRPMPLTSSSWDRSQIEAHQLASLRSLLPNVLPNNPFYSAKFRAAGAGPDFASLGEFFKSAPFTSKQEIVEDQLRHPPFGSNLTYPLERYTRFSQTSATTGKPLRWLDTPE